MLVWVLGGYECEVALDVHAGSDTVTGHYGGGE
jgi:hypothetical protein